MVILDVYRSILVCTTAYTRNAVNALEQLTHFYHPNRSFRTPGLPSQEIINMLAPSRSSQDSSTRTVALPVPAPRKTQATAEKVMPPAPARQEPPPPKPKQPELYLVQPDDRTPTSIPIDISMSVERPLAAKQQIKPTSFTRMVLWTLLVALIILISGIWALARSGHLTVFREKYRILISEREQQLADETQKLEQQNSVLGAQVATVQQANSQLQAQYRDKDNEFRVAEQARVSNLQNLNETKHQLEATRQQLEDAEKRLKERDLEISMLKQGLVQNEKDRKSLPARYRRLLREHTDATKELELARQTNSETSKIVLSLRKKEEKLGKAIADLSKEKTALADQNSALQKQLASALDLKGKKKTEFERLQKAVATAEASLRKANEKVVETKSDSDRRIARLEKSVATEKARANSERSRADKAERQAAIARAAAEAAKKESYAVVDREGEIIITIWQAITAVESGGSYDTVSEKESPRNTPPRGPLANGLSCKTGTYCDYAYGRYQIMGDNIPSWTEKFLNIRLTPEEFIRGPNLETTRTNQDIVARKQLREYWLKTVTPQMPNGDVRVVAACWHSSTCNFNSDNEDSLGTSTKEYVNAVVSKIAPIRPDLVKFPKKKGALAKAADKAVETVKGWVTPVATAKKPLKVAKASYRRHKK